jgi:hypothetical protein
VGTDSTVAAPADAGRKLGRFEVLDTVAQERSTPPTGSRESKLERVVAIKVRRLPRLGSGRYTP